MKVSSRKKINCKIKGIKIVVYVKIIYFFVFVILFYNENIFAVNLHEQNQLAWRLSDSQKYDEAFKLFNESCLKYNDPEGCVGLTVCYMNGWGVPQNADEAFSIAKNLSQSQDEQARDSGKALCAEIAEQLGGDNVENINFAMNLYSELQNSKVPSIAQQAKDAISRIKTYNFLEQIFDYMDKFIKHNINAENFKVYIDNLQISDQPEKIQTTFLDVKPFMIYSIESDQWYRDNRTSTLLSLGSKIINKDFTILKDAVDLLNLKSKNKNNSKVFDEKFKTFLQAALDIGISQRWIKMKFDSMVPQK